MNCLTKLEIFRMFVGLWLLVCDVLSRSFVFLVSRRQPLGSGAGHVHPHKMPLALSIGLRDWHHELVHRRFARAITRTIRVFKCLFTSHDVVSCALSYVSVFVSA